MTYPYRHASPQDEQAVIDYSLDWTGWLGAGETVASHAVSAPAGITLVSSGLLGDVVSWRLSGGTAGQSYDITIEVTTDLGQVDQRTVRVPVAQR